MKTAQNRNPGDPDARAFVTLENVADVRYKRYRDGDYSPGFVGNGM